MNISHYLTSDANLLETLMINNVKFHKSCLNKLTRINRKEKRPYEKVEESECASPAKTRNSSGDSRGISHGVDSLVCLFRGIEDLHDVLHIVSFY